MKEDIKKILPAFFAQTKTDSLESGQYPLFYSGLKLKAGFGIGTVAKVPWIAFLVKGQKVTDGIFPVFYFFKENHKLILAYGISETEITKKNWNVPADTKTISQYFHQFGIKPHKYDLSYVYEAYETNHDLDYNKIESDLNNLIAYYKKIMQSK